MIELKQTGSGFPGITVLSLSPTCEGTSAARATSKQEVVHWQQRPPIEGVNQLAALLPEVLARYGIESKELFRAVA